MAANSRANEDDEVLMQSSPTEEQIRERAYEIYMRRGCDPGGDVEDWLQAEKELGQTPQHTGITNNGSEK